MIAFGIAAIAASEYTKILAGLIAGSAIVRAWFNKEIKAGKALFARLESKTAADIANAEAHLYSIGVQVFDKVKTDAKAVEADVKKI